MMYLFAAILTIAAVQHNAVHAPSDSGQHHIFGYPTHQDPLFDHGTRPDYVHQHLEPRHYDRPAYNPPGYVVPIWREEPIRKPVYHVPLAVMPNDNRPKYNIRNYQPPAYIKPGDARPAWRDHGNINYVIKPIVRPAYVHPGYDRSVIHYDRPEYIPPVYVPQEYKPPRELPPPYIAPPR